jgi:hypothetical protein
MREGLTEMNQCLLCGNGYVEGMEGVCRSCWEKYQFPTTGQGKDEGDAGED